MDAHLFYYDMAKIKQELNRKFQNNIQNMSSCMYQQSVPFNHVTSTIDVSGSKLFTFHMAKENAHLSNCSRRLDFSQADQHMYYGLKHGSQVSVARRNERERNRVKLINMTFATLREHLPYEPETSNKSKKMSKVDTLKAAIDYIRYLQELVGDQDSVNSMFSDSCSIDPCVQLNLESACVPHSSPSTHSINSESSFDGLSTEEEDLLDFASWF